MQSHHHSSLGVYFKIYWNLGEEIKTWNEGQDQKEKRESTRFNFSHNACYSCHCWRAVMIRKENDDDERVMGLYELKEREMLLKKWVKWQKITAILMTGPLRPGMGLFWNFILFVLGKKKQPKERARDDFPFPFSLFFLDRNFLFTTIKILESQSKFPFHSLIIVCPFYCPSTSSLPPLFFFTFGPIIICQKPIN